MVSIPQEAQPQVNLGMIHISTVYVGASPQDVDDLVTSELESAIKDVDGIKKVESSSRTGVSSILVTVKDSFDPKVVMMDVSAEVDKVSLPDGVEDPDVIDITTDSNGLFTLLLYSERDG